MPSVDNRVVKMDFQNAQFQKGVTETLGSLESLTQKINDTTGIKLDSLSSSVEEVGGKFSWLNVAVGTGLAKLTNSALDAGISVAKNLWDPLVEGGKKRSLTIEQAKFQFQGLGLDVEAMMASATEAVAGTAYGLDEAAKIASIFATSGVEAGDEMVQSLRAVAGTAAMSGASFMDVGDIFADVQGKSRATSEDLNRLAERGIGSFAVMADYLGVTQDEVRRLASTGKISADQFSAAFSEAFGDQATKANETFTGSLANMKAALSRIGALYYDVKHQAQIPVNNQAAETLNSIKDALIPVQDLYRKFATTKSNTLVAGLKAVQFVVEKSAEPFGNLVRAVGNVYDAIQAIIKPIKDAFAEVFAMGEGSGPLHKALIAITGAIEKFTSYLILAEGPASAIKAVFKGLFTVIKFGFSIIGFFIKIIAGAFVLAWKALGAAIKFVTPFIKNIGSVLKPLGDQLKILKDALVGAYKSVKDFFATLKSGGPGAISNITKALNKWVSSKVGPWVEKLTTFVNDLIKALERWVKLKVVPFIDGISKSIPNVVKALQQWVTTDLGSWLEGAKMKAVGFLKVAQQWVKTDLKPWFSGAIAYLGDFGARFGDLKEAAIGAGKGIKTNFGNAMSSMGKGTTGMIDGIKNGFSSFWETIQSMGSGIKNALGTAGDWLSKFFGGVDFMDILLSANATAFVLLISEIVKALNGFTAPFEKIGGIADNFTEAIGKVGDGLKKFHEETPAGKLLKIAVAIGILAGSIWLLSTLETSKVVISLVAIAGIMLVLAGGIALIGLAMKGIKAKKMIAASKGIQSLAIAILVLSFAIEKFGNMSIEELVKGLIATAVALIILVGAAALIGDSKVGKRLPGFAFGIALLSGALWILAEVVKKFGQLKLSTLVKGLLSMEWALMMMLGTVMMLGNAKTAARLIVFAVGVAALSVALYMLLYVIKEATNIPWEDFLNGLAKVALMLGVLVLAALGLGAAGFSMLAASIGLVIMTLALAGMLVIVMLLSQIPWEVFLDGFWKFVLLLGALTIAVVAMSLNAAGTLAAAVALLALAFAVAVMVAAVYLLGSMDLPTLITGLIALAVILVMLVVAANAMTTAIVGAGAMVVMAIAIGILAAALWLLAGLSPEQIIWGLVGIAGSLGILIIAGFLAEAAAPGIFILVGAIVALALAAMIVALAVVVFALGIGLLGVMAGIAAGGLTILAEAAKGSTDAILPLIGLGAGLLVFGIGAIIAGVGALLLGVGLLAMGAGLILIAGAGPMGTLALKDLIKTFGWNDIAKATALGVALVALGAGLIVVGVGALLTGVGLLLVSLGMNTFNSAVNKLKTAVKKLVPEITKLGGTVGELNSFTLALTLFATVCAAAGGSMSKLGTSTTKFALAVGITSGLVNTFTSTISTMPAAVLTASAGVTAAFGMMKQGVVIGMTGMVTVFNAQSRVFTMQVGRLASDVGKGMQQVGLAVLRAVPFVVVQVTILTNTIGSTLRRGMATQASQASAQGATVGRNIAYGMANGVYQGLGAVLLAAVTVATRALAAARAALGIRSPSREFAKIGKFSDEGLAQGLRDNAGIVSNAGTEVGKAALNSVVGIVKQISDALDENIDYQPTIRPVLDLTGVQDNVAVLDSIPSTYAGYLDVSTNLAASANLGYENNREAVEGVVTTGNNTTIEYNQYNNSPKSLSNVEIYRQTRNQLSTLKGRVNIDA